MLPRLDAAVTPVKPADGAGAGAAVGEGRQAAFQRAIQSLVGQTVSAEVMSKLKDGSYLVKVAENSVRMALPGDTQVGGKVPLTVLSAQPRPTFQLGNAAPGSAPTVLYTDSGIAEGGEAATLPSQGTAVYVPGGGKPAAGTPPATPQAPGGAAAQDGAAAADGEALPGQLKPGASPGAGPNGGAASSPAGAPAAGSPAASARPGLPAGAPDANDAATPAGQPGRPGAAGNANTATPTATPGAAANPASTTLTSNPAAAGNAAAAPSSSATPNAGAAPNAGNTPNAATSNPASASTPGAATPGATPNLPAAANAAGLANPAAAQAAPTGTPNPAGTQPPPTAPAGAAQLSAAALAAGGAGDAAPADGVKPQTLAATLLGKAPLTPSHELPELGANAQQATLSSAARVLTNVLSTAAGQPGQMMQLALVGKTALFGKADPDTADLANKLHETISKSGLFYESHVAEWAKGERPLAELMREPQMQRLLQQGQESLARSAANGPDLSAAQMINQQLHTQEQNRVLWNGQAWPGQPMQWEVRRDEREGGKGGGDSEAEAGPVWRSGVRFRLPLLGDVSAAVTMIGKQVHIQVQTGEEGSALTLRAWAGRLESAMAAAGAQLSSLTISQDDEARP